MALYLLIVVLTSVVLMYDIAKLANKFSAMTMVTGYHKNVPDVAGIFMKESGSGGQYSVA